jgi:hypothetical protein
MLAPHSEAAAAALPPYYPYLTFAVFQVAMALMSIAAVDSIAGQAKDSIIETLGAAAFFYLFQDCLGKLQR